MQQLLQREFQKFSLYKQFFWSRTLCNEKELQISLNERVQVRVGVGACLWTPGLWQHPPAPARAQGCTQPCWEQPFCCHGHWSCSNAVFLKRCFCGFPQAQPRPELPSWLLKIWSSRKSPPESLPRRLGKTGSRLWPGRDADLSWKISWLPETLWHWAPGHLPCIPGISLFYLFPRELKTLGKIAFSTQISVHPDIWNHRRSR